MTITGADEVPPVLQEMEDDTIRKMVVVKMLNLAVCISTSGMVAGSAVGYWFSIRNSKQLGRWFRNACFYLWLIV